MSVIKLRKVDSERARATLLTQKAVVHFRLNQDRGVEQLMEPYTLDREATRYYFRSLPEAPRTHMCVKDAYVDFDKNDRVVNIAVFIPTD